MICPPLSPTPLVRDWIDRHRYTPSLILHVLGIPPTILGVLLIPVYLPILSLRLFLFALVMFVGGYLLQFLGHALEWTEPGEIAAMRRWLASRLTGVRSRRVTSGI